MACINTSKDSKEEEVHQQIKVWTLGKGIPGMGRVRASPDLAIQPARRWGRVETQGNLHLPSEYIWVRALLKSAWKSSSTDTYQYYSATYKDYEHMFTDAVQSTLLRVWYCKSCWRSTYSYIYHVYSAITIYLSYTIETVVGVYTQLLWKDTASIRMLP